MTAIWQEDDFILTSFCNFTPGNDEHVITGGVPLWASMHRDALLCVFFVQRAGDQFLNVDQRTAVDHVVKGN